MAAVDIFTNRASTTVSSGGTSAPSAGTTETWTVGSSAAFPAASNTAATPTQFHVVDVANPSEIILVRNVSGTTWSITRGDESTTPVAHTTGFTVKHVVTAGFLERISVSDYGRSAGAVSIAEYDGWDSSSSATMTTARDAAAADAWGGSWRRWLEYPHHPTLDSYTFTTPHPYADDMGIRGLGTNSREFNTAGTVQLKYAGAGMFFDWNAGLNQRFVIENILFSGNQLPTTTSVFFQSTGSGHELWDATFVECSWKFFQTVIDSPVLRVTIVGEAMHVNNGTGRQFYLRGSDVKIRGNLFLASFPLANTVWLAELALSMSEVDRIYVTPAPNMGVKFRDNCAGLRTRIVSNGLNDVVPWSSTGIGLTAYATTAAFPTASSANVGMLYKADNDIKTYRSNGSTYDVFWDGVTPTAGTTLPSSGTTGQMFEDTGMGTDPIRYYRWDGNHWVGPKYHTSGGLATPLPCYDGADGPGIQFDQVDGGMDLDAYVALCGTRGGTSQVVGGFRDGMLAVYDCADELSMRIDLDYLVPKPTAAGSDKPVYSFISSTGVTPSGTSMKVRINDNLGRPHLGGRVTSPRIKASGTNGALQLDYARLKAQPQARRPATWETVDGTVIGTGAALTLNTLYLGPFDTSRRVTAAAFEVTAAVATAACRIVLYFDNNEGWPGALAYDSGTVAAATTGQKNPGTQPDLPPGRYWVGLVAQTAAANVRQFTGVTNGIPQTGPTGVNMTALTNTGVSGAPPNPFPTTGIGTTVINAALLPTVWLQST